jgi:hypothetical protein
VCVCVHIRHTRQQILSVPSVLVNVFYIEFQTYVLRLDLIINIVSTCSTVAFLCVVKWLFGICVHIMHLDLILNISRVCSKVAFSVFRVCI